MNFNAVKWALSQAIKHSPAKFVLVAIASCAEQGTHRCWSSIALLADKTGQDTKTVRRNLILLGQMGFLCDTGERKGGTKKVVVYRLNDPTPCVHEHVFDDEDKFVLDGDFSVENSSDFSKKSVPSCTNFQLDSGQEKLPNSPSNTANFSGKHYQIRPEILPKLATEVIIKNKEKIFKKLQGANAPCDASKNRPRKSSPKTPEKPIAETALPAWLPAEAWADFVEHRRACKKPLTGRAVALAIGKLDELRRQGYEPQKVIEQSIFNGWCGVFGIRERKPALAGRMGDFRSEKQRRQDAERDFYAGITQLAEGVPMSATGVGDVIDV